MPREQTREFNGLSHQSSTCIQISQSSKKGWVEVRLAAGTAQVGKVALLSKGNGTFKKREFMPFCL